MSLPRFVTNGLNTPSVSGSETWWRTVGLLTALLATSAFSTHAISAGLTASDEVSCPPEQGFLTQQDVPQGTDVDACDLTGRVIAEGDVALPVPPNGQFVQYSTLVATGEVGEEFRISVSGSGILAYNTVTDSSEAVIDSSPACDSDFYQLAHQKWYSTAHWYINKGSIPNNDLSVDNTVDALRAAVRNIVDQQTDCPGYTDLVSATAQYEGDTNRDPDIHRVNGNSLCKVAPQTDGYSTVGFGSHLDSDVIMGTCAWGPNHQEALDEIDQADIEINRALSFTTFGDSATCQYQYDIQNVATHEWGHAFGLDHAKGRSTLTMFGSSDQCEVKKRTLGRGDILGLRQYY